MYNSALSHKPSELCATFLLKKSAEGHRRHSVSTLGQGWESDQKHVIIGFEEHIVTKAAATVAEDNITNTLTSLNSSHNLNTSPGT